MATVPTLEYYANMQIEGKQLTVDKTLQSYLSNFCFAISTSIE